jgi:hypothetical protein
VHNPGDIGIRTGLRLIYRSSVDSSCAVLCIISGNADP